MDTIFALASAKGRAGVAVIRISGPDAVSAVGHLCLSVPTDRGLRQLHDLTGQLLDQALVLRFAKDRSFTGEEVVELHLHGSPAVVRAVLQTLGDVPELRIADAGEFTRRALDNGRLNLAEVEGLADLIDAETESQRKQAMRVFSGALGALAESWRRDLVRAAALLEATIDFVDEDVPVDVSPEVIDLISSVMLAMQREADGVQIAERVRDGFEVAIIGAPNVGKSTLLNNLAGRDVAITSDIAGTTRDVLEVQMDLDGLPVTMLDTAGLRETQDRVEGLGVERAMLRADAADLRIHLIMKEEDRPGHIGADDIVVWAKADMSSKTGLSVSGLTGLGVDALVAEVGSRLAQKVARVGTAMRERHRQSLLRALEHLDAAKASLADGDGMIDLIAEELRCAQRAVDSIVGLIDVEHVLDEIFSSFCIGK